MRKVLEKIFPASWVPYLLHLRPRAWFIVIAHMSVGFIIANGYDQIFMHWKQWLLAAITWGIFGNGGTLAINSAYDKDEGDIGYLENPPPVPTHLARFSLILLGIGAILSIPLGLTYFLAYLLCAILSILYSVPPMRLKARAGFDVVINCIGYGGLTLFAGWAAAGRSIEAPIINLFFAFFFLFLGFYPLTQIYQIEEDVRRGDHTLAIALGKKRALQLALLSVSLAFFFIGYEVFAHYLNIRSLTLLIAIGAWGLLLIPWYRKHAIWKMLQEQKGFYQALTAWAITDVAVIISMTQLA
ncbi:MAG: UbiA family prenyltransferase [Anaerolineaceae bacterium]|nr:UbiA family prenyltransferase [Anaerolineaceae bacterium]